MLKGLFNLLKSPSADDLKLAREHQQTPTSQCAVVGRGTMRIDPAEIFDSPNSRKTWTAPGGSSTR